MTDIQPEQAKVDPTQFATDLSKAWDTVAANRYAADLAAIANTHATRLWETSQAAADQNRHAFGELLPRFAAPQIASDFADYLTDFAQRQILYMDVLRQRGNNFIEHEEDRAAPVLAFDYEVIVDGRTLGRPVNYRLVRIVPPEGVEQREDGRPYIIIDPRAGHGSGIGGFKDASEVGCALRAGHPVYFVIFTRKPEPGQTMADVCAAEAGLVREVRRRHPDAPNPIIIGNCQGGWATMLLAATNPDITGPIVANGAPVSYWAGETGRNPMRYLGGVHGGVLPAMVMSDLGNGLFDGANLVFNFEALSPANTWWGKYYDLFANVDREGPRFLEFERWWGGFYYMTEQEIRWIVENLFVGNRLGRGQAQLDERTHVDLRQIQSPIIVFASHGDNITPPQQALDWIADLYKTAEEIKVRGQRIIYTIHENIGHLGIFVSSKVAAREHSAIVSTLKTIEALAPGLYEMVITDEQGDGLEKRYTVAFEQRSIDDILALDDGRRDERPFAAAARASELSAELYDLTLRPFVRAMATPQTAEALAEMHPIRAQRYALSDRNPWLVSLPGLAETVRESRKPASAHNPFRQLEQLTAVGVTAWWNLLRDVRAAWIETAFFSLWGAPFATNMGERFARHVSDAPLEDLLALDHVQQALENMHKGGFAEAVIRMLILLAHARGAVRRDRLERSSAMLETTEPFASMRPKRRTRLIHEESLIVTFKPEAALAALPLLVRTAEEREKAIATCFAIAGPAVEMDDATVKMFDEFARVLGVANPLADQGERHDSATRRSRKTADAAD